MNFGHCSHVTHTHMHGQLKKDLNVHVQPGQIYIIIILLLYTLLSVLDDVAPLKTRCIKKTTKQLPWIDDELRRMKSCTRRRERKERVWKRLRLTTSCNDFVTQRKFLSNSIRSQITDHYHEIFNNCKGNYKVVFKQANRLLFRKEPSPLP